MPFTKNSNGFEEWEIYFLLGRRMRYEWQRMQRSAFCSPETAILCLFYFTDWHWQFHHRVHADISRVWQSTVMALTCTFHQSFVDRNCWPIRLLIFGNNVPITLPRLHSYKIDWQFVFKIHKFLNIHWKPAINRIQETRYGITCIGYIHHLLMTNTNTKLILEFLNSIETFREIECDSLRYYSWVVIHSSGWRSLVNGQHTRSQKVCTKRVLFRANWIDFGPLILLPITALHLPITMYSWQEIRLICMAIGVPKVRKFIWMEW